MGRPLIYSATGPYSSLWNRESSIVTSILSGIYRGYSAEYLTSRMAQQKFSSARVFWGMTLICKCPGNPLAVGSWIRRNSVSLIIALMLCISEAYISWGDEAIENCESAASEIVPPKLLPLLLLLACDLIELGSQLLEWKDIRLLKWSSIKDTFVQQL